MSELGIEEYKQLAESVPALCYVADNNLHFRYINPFFSQVHGITQEAAIGKHISEVIGQQGYKNNLENYKKVLGGHVVKYSSSFLKANGKPHYYHAIYTPFFKDGNLFGFTGVVVDITAEKELEKISKTDALTQLNNRRKFDEKMQEYLGGNSKKHHALILLDIDNFKTINDELGHSKGDDALINLGVLLETLVHYPEQVYRVGGEEFAITLPEISDRSELEKWANNLCTQISSTEILAERSITASVGAVLFNTGDKRETVLKNVDNAMYTSKSNGKNQVNIA